MGDGKASCTAAIRKAIAACYAAGGGTRRRAGRTIPHRRHPSAKQRQPSRRRRATLAFTDDHRRVSDRLHPLGRRRADELLARSSTPSTSRTSRSPARGTLDGQADAEHWWHWRLPSPGNPGRDRPARNRLIEMQAKGVPVAERVFGAARLSAPELHPAVSQPEHPHRRPRPSSIRRCGRSIPVLCRSVTVRNVTIRSHGPNNDGCNPESCRDVLIEGCTFDTGDDCIALKSGRNDDGRRINVPVENVVIRNCTMKDGHGGVVIGSEISGGARNIFAEKCQMSSPAARSRAAHQDQLGPRRRDRRRLHARRDRRRGRGGGRDDQLLLRGRGGRARTSRRRQGHRRPQRHQPARANTRCCCADSRTRRSLACAFEDCTFDGVAKGDLLENVKGVELRNVRVNGVCAMR